jgi:hypothetical protein
MGLADFGSFSFHCATFSGGFKEGNIKILPTNYRQKVEESKWKSAPDRFFRFTTKYTPVNGYHFSPYPTHPNPKR